VSPCAGRLVPRPRWRAALHVPVRALRGSLRRAAARRRHGAAVFLA